MEDRVGHKPWQGLPVETSVELARKHANSTNTSRLVGTKRSHASISTTLSGEGRTALSDMRNGPNLPATRPHSSPSKRPRRLEASKIRWVADCPNRPSISEYTQRKLAASTPRASQNLLLSLRHPKYGLPPALVKNLETLGVQSIYPWQSSCLLGRGLLSGEKNLVYTAPTGGGKSLVADVLMLKRMIESPMMKAIVVLPYVALVQEKLKWLRRVVEGVRRSIEAADEPNAKRAPWQLPQGTIRVAEFHGGSKARSTWSDIDIAVCTIEKANSLVNTAIDEGRIEHLGVVILDELHMLDDEHRGYMMELMATKLLSLQHDIRIYGMSATLPNTELIAKWLDAKFYRSRYRPIPIEQFLVYENSIYPTGISTDFTKLASQLISTLVAAAPSDVPPVRNVESSIYKELESPITNAAAALAVETAQAGYGALIFCGSRQRCQTLASLISEVLPDKDALDQRILDRRRQVVAELQSLPGGLDPVFERTIIKGVAFHHAGLTSEEREIVAAAYDTGVLKVLTATCTLAAGINLPARRVILHGARMGRDLVGPAMLRQMRGRAGRKGKDEVGETYVCCEIKDVQEVAALLDAELPPVVSSLTPEKRGIKRALLEVIATRLATSLVSINDYVTKTLLYQTMDHDKLSKMVDDTIQDLLETECIQETGNRCWEATRLGQAIVAAALTPEDGIFVHAELKRALQAFVMDGEMHIFYTFTPVQIGSLSEIVWPIFQKEMDRLDESSIRALQFIGIKPTLVNTMVRTGASLREITPEEINLARIYRRVYSAFQLRDLCNEMPIYAVARKYDTFRGFVQNLAQTCHGFGAGIIKFCERLGWGMMAAVLDHMLDRLKAGAKADLLEMCQVPFVKSRMARMFWEHGFRSVRAIAEAEPKDLVPILLLAQSRKVASLVGDTAEKLNTKMGDRAEIIVAAANRLWERQMQVDLDE